MEATSQTQTAQVSAPSATPTSVAQPSASQPAMSQPSISPGISSPGSVRHNPRYQPTRQQRPRRLRQRLRRGIHGRKRSRRFQRKFEYKQPLPGPGAVLGLSDTDASGASTSKLGFSSAVNGSTFGSPDLQSPSFNPSLLNRPGCQCSRANAAPELKRR